ncbi:MAG: nucleotidyltransferase domain-containing protein [Candidatus Nealsonbacteria bacterium]|nr:nucleotidyltransferase domain-containing protein [Candidatus Nealsonbacteria bacterium]
MSTLTDNPIGSALFSKNRRALLALLYGHPDRAFYFRQIVRLSGGGHGAVQRELGQLTAAGILRRTVRDTLVYFQANEDCPVFEELKSMVVKTVGVADVLRAALGPLADRITAAFIFGSVAGARQTRDSDVDLVVIGEVTFAEVVAALTEAQENLGREVNPVVYSRDEFQAKMRSAHPFLGNVMNSDKVFLIGDEDELAGLAK